MRIKLYLLASLVVCGVGLLVGVYFLKPAQAAIATNRDWIGLYPKPLAPPPTANGNGFIDFSNYDVAGRNFPAAYSGVAQWVYPINGACNKALQNTPWLAANCTSGLTYPTQAGAYEFRLYAYDTFHLMAISGTVWVEDASTWRMTAEPRCSIDLEPIVILGWSPFVGIVNVEIDRNGTAIMNCSPSLNTCTDNDPSLQRNTLYSYQVQAVTATGEKLPSNNGPLNVTTLACLKPFLQTTGGDVHSNQNINVPGGP